MIGRWVARQSAAAAFAVLAIVAPGPSLADNADSAPGAIGGALAMATVATFLCWTASYAESRSDTPTEDGDRQDAGYDRRGWLVGIEGSYAIENFREQEEADLQAALVPNTVSLSMGNSGGVSGRLGYRCNRRFSAEVEVEWLHAFAGELSDPIQGAVAANPLGPIFTRVNAKGYLLTGRVQPFLLFGAGALSVESVSRDLVSGSGSKSLTQAMFTLRFGGGIDVYATEHVVINVGADYVLPVAGIKNFEYITIGAGLEYRF